jgi:hypothetical protein
MSPCTRANANKTWTVRVRLERTFKVAQRRAVGRSHHTDSARKYWYRRFNSGANKPSAERRFGLLKGELQSAR